MGGLSARGFIERRSFRQECFLGKCDRSLMRSSIRPEIRAGALYTLFLGESSFQKTLAKHFLIGLRLHAPGSPQPPSPSCPCRTFRDCTKKQLPKTTQLALNRRGQECGSSGTFRLPSGPPWITPVTRRSQQERHRDRAASRVHSDDDGKWIAEALDRLYPGGSGIERLRQILFARRLAISP